MKTLVIFIFMLIGAYADAQTITTIAGGGTMVGDGGPATAAILNAANGGAFDKHGNYYVCEAIGNRVRKISPSGIITRVAGTGGTGYNGDGIPATSAKLFEPSGAILDTFGNVYINDLSNFRIRKVDAITGLISTIAGTGVAGFFGENIPATDAQLGGVNDICFDKFGNMYLGDYVNHRVRKINTSGIISTFAGTGGLSSTGTGDGGPATAATFNIIAGLVADDSGNVYVADGNAAKVRKINTAGIITTIAGTGVYPYIGDGIPATDAQIHPIRLTFDNAKNLVIADDANYRVLKIDNAGIIHNIAGNGGTGHSGDGGPATAATVDFPAGIVYDTCGNLYIAESDNKDVRKVTFNPACSLIDSTPLNVIIDIRPSVLIYPNPVEEVINIEIVTSGSYQLLNIFGVTVKNGELEQGNNCISMQAFPSGMYILAFTDGDNKKVINRIFKR